MSLDALDRSFANKLKVHAYLNDESNLRFYSTRQKTVRAMSANDSFSNYGTRIIIYPNKDKVFLTEDNGCSDFRDPFDTLEV